MPDNILRYVFEENKKKTIQIRVDRPLFQEFVSLSSFSHSLIMALSLK